VHPTNISVRPLLIKRLNTRHWWLPLLSLILFLLLLLLLLSLILLHYSYSSSNRKGYSLHACVDVMSPVDLDSLLDDAPSNFLLEFTPLVSVHSYCSIACPDKKVAILVMCLTSSWDIVVLSLLRKSKPMLYYHIHLPILIILPLLKCIYPHILVFLYVHSNALMIGCSFEVPFCIWSVLFWNLYSQIAQLLHSIYYSYHLY
jgi:hypothetical protein